MTVEERLARLVDLAESAGIDPSDRLIVAGRSALEAVAAAGLEMPAVFVDDDSRLAVSLEWSGVAGESPFVLVLDIEKVPGEVECCLTHVAGNTVAQRVEGTTGEAVDVARAILTDRLSPPQVTVSV